MKKIRLDKLLMINGLADSRAKAQYYIKSGIVKVNGIIETKKSADYSKDDKIELTSDICPFVSFGGLKLQKAIEVFEVDFKDKIVLDIGASTGGFSDCALQSGARLVYAIDVGKDQLAEKLIADQRVISYENFNLKNIKQATFSFLFDIVVTDVSFISLTHVFNVLENCLKEEGIFIALIKPQFEVGPKNVTKGIVKSKELHYFAIDNVLSYAKEKGFNLNKLTFSPNKDGKGNIEYLSLFSKASPQMPELNINKVVEQAWETI